MNRRRLITMATAILIATISLGTWAQPDTLPGYERSDLHLISQESLPHWTPEWTGPIQGATLLAWLHDNGYSRLLRDFNGDGVIDELDTIELANVLGRGLMGTETPAGTTDVRLVVGLARYIADLYPDEFVIKIYDASFPTEYTQQTRSPFAPDAIAGITMSIEGEPSIDAYKWEMETAEGVILGLEEEERKNTYLSGRSFLYNLTPQGFTPIDLAWAEEDRWVDGHQGQVLETVARMDDRMFMDYRGNWTLVECMIAVSPVREASGASEPHPCPDDAIAYDVTENTTPYGRVIIEECVTREEYRGILLDTYEYTVTNVDFMNDGCGFCYFAIPDVGVTTTMNMTGPAFWVRTHNWAAWRWVAPIGSCGILPGEVGVFSFTIVGPSFDVWLTGGLGNCDPDVLPGEISVISVFPVRTTGPGEGIPDDEPGACCLPDGSCVELDPLACSETGGDYQGDGIDCTMVQCPGTADECPDLIVEITRLECTVGREYEVTVTVDVTNIGTVIANNVRVEVEADTENDTDLHAFINPSQTRTSTFTLTFGINSPPPCPLPVTATVDPFDSIVECDEDNNEDTDSVYCPNCK